MLKLSCRRFRMEFTPGAESPHDAHRKSCPACAAYAAAVERAAKKAPLPSRLRSKLRAVPGAAVDDGPRLPIPPAPMPGPLRDRLRQMSRRREAPPLPAWVRSSRYAVAASYLLAVLLGATIGNPAEAAGAVSRSVERAVRPRVENIIETVEGRGRRRLDDLESAVRERYGATRETVEHSLENLEHRLEYQATELDEMRKSLFSLDLLTDWNEGD
jgi:anti-sigma factor RsiW